MKELGIFSKVSVEVGLIIVAGVNAVRIKELLSANQVALHQLITKS